MTTEELFDKYKNYTALTEGYYEYLVDDEDFKEALIEFAKYHVTKVLEKAAFNSQVEVVDHEPLSEMAKKAELLPIYGVDESSILKAYPLVKIE